MVFFAESFPDLINKTVEEEDSNRSKIETREVALDDKDIMDVAILYGADVSRLERTDEDFFELPVDNHFSDKRIPQGYGYKGGAVRALLLRNLGIDSTYMPRDVDVVRIAEKEPYHGADNELAAEFMAEDFELGDGIEAIWDEYHYFNTRDLTINEVLATDTKVKATRRCILDNIRYVIRLSVYEMNKARSNSENKIYDKMLAKILRLYVEFIHKYDEALIEGVDNWQFEQYFISPFWLAVQLDRAYQLSRTIAIKYVEQLKKNNQIPKEIETPEQTAVYLSNLLTQATFHYRHAPIG
ncbi:MAG: hypothetical protein ABH832_00445 [bacterium]